MPEKESPWVYFEGIKVPKKCTDLSYYVIFSKPVEIATKQGWIPISKTKGVVEADSMIEGWVMRWILEKNYDYPSGKTEIESAGYIEDEELRKTIETIKKTDMTKIFPNHETDSVVTTVEVIKPVEEEKHISTREEFDRVVERSMQFKEISVSLGQKVSIDYQSRNAQVGAVISVGNVSPELAYQSAINFVKDRLKEEVKKIREEML